MKHFLTLATKKTMLISATLLGVCIGATAQPFNVLTRGFVSNSLPTATPPPDVLRVQNGLLAHDGNPQTTANTGNPTLVGTFGANAKWIGIGAPVTPGNLLYGERTQWNEQAFIKALRQRSTTDVTKDAILEWGGGVASQVGSEMQFRHITNPTSPTGFTRILTMKTNGNSYFGTSDPGFNSRLGVFATNQTSLACTTSNLTAGYFEATANVAFGNPAQTRAVYGIIKLNGPGGGFFQRLRRSAAVSGVIDPTFTGTINRVAYGVFGSAPVSPTSGVGNVNTSYAGFFQGDVYVTNQLFGSDAKYKINVADEVDALPRILRARPVTYNFDTVRFKGFNFSSRRQHGFIAQQIAEIFPEAVQNANLSFPSEQGDDAGGDVGLALNYVNLISVLFRGVQEQQAQINELRQLLGLAPVTATSANIIAANNQVTSGNQLTADANNPAPAQRINTSVGEFTAADFKMEQNVPNPFSGNTIIRYTLPNRISNAFIGVYNLQGTQLLRFDRLNGGSQVTINANTLQPGIYIYSLVAEGQEVLSKRMVVSR